MGDTSDRPGFAADSGLVAAEGPISPAEVKADRGATCAEIISCAAAQSEKSLLRTCGKDFSFLYEWIDENSNSKLKRSLERR